VGVPRAACRPRGTVGQDVGISGTDYL